MEKDKRKKEEEDIRKKRTLEKKRKARQEQEALVSNDPTSSKFDTDKFEDSDDDDESDEAEEKEVKTDPRKNRKSRFEEVEAPKLVLSREPPVKSKEELIQEMSINLRKILTTILLEVTSEEITEISEEVLRKEKGRKGKPQLKSMLSGYGSNSDSEDEDDEDDIDSDEEIQKTLKKKKMKFTRMEDSIKENCEKEEKLYKKREKRWLAGRTSEPRATSPESSNGRTASPSPSRDKSSRKKNPVAVPNKTFKKAKQVPIE